MSDADYQHTSACNDNALTFHAATGGDADCICEPVCETCGGEGQVLGTAEDAA